MMVLIFTNTTSVLSAEFMSIFSAEKLELALFRIGQETGVEFHEFSQAQHSQRSFSITGDWGKVTLAHTTLQEYFEKEQQAKQEEETLEREKYSTLEQNALSTESETESRHGRNAGCTVAKTAFNVVSEPYVQYHNDKGLQMAIQCQKTESTYSKIEIIDDVEEVNDTSHGNSGKLNAKRYDTGYQDEEHTNIKDVHHGIIVNNENEFVMVKEEFDDNAMDDDADIDEQYLVNTGDILKTKTSCSNSAIIEVVDDSAEINVMSHGESGKSDSEKHDIYLDTGNQDESLTNIKDMHHGSIVNNDNEFVKEFDDNANDDDTDIDEQYLDNTDILKTKPSCSDELDLEVKVEKITSDDKEMDRRPRLKENQTENCKRERKKKKKVTKSVIEDTEYKCDKCEYVGKKKENLRDHTKRMHRIKFACETCKKTFGLRNDLLRHTYVHMNPAYHCKICDKFYRSSRSYKEHMSSHEENYVKPEIECEVCHKAFSTKYVLAAHVKSKHLGMKKSRSFLCSTCGRSFKQKSNYVMHANIHAGIKPYVCDVCGKAFSHIKTLKNHRYLHDDERRFICDVCAKTFKIKSSLHIHMKVHKEARDYICTACGKGFTQKQALVRHERIHSGDKPFKCALCLRSFNDYSIIRRHMMMHHKRNKDPKTWRGDIICSLKRKTELNIEGGPGYNGGDSLPTRS